MHPKIGTNENKQIKKNTEPLFRSSIIRFLIFRNYFFAFLGSYVDLLMKSDDRQNFFNNIYLFFRWLYFEHKKDKINEELSKVDAEKQPTS